MNTNSPTQKGEAAGPDRSGRKTAPPGTRVLILDDDQLVADVIGRALRSLGCETETALAPSAFFAALGSFSPTHLVIDLFMPEMDGLAVLHRLAELGCDARIIVTSGHELRLLESMRQSARALGLDVIGRLEKPFRMARLAELMAQQEDPAEAQAAQPLREDVAPAPLRGPQALAVVQDALAAPLPDLADLGGDPLAIDFVTGLATGQLQLYLQNKVSCSTRSVVGHEALVRWYHPEKGIVPPAQFVPEIEARGLEHLLARHMLELAMSHLSRHGAGLHMSVNVSLATFRMACFRQTLGALRERYDIAPERIILELTETGTSEILPSDIDTLTRLRLDGYQLAIDDFGIGMSSLQRLVQLPFSEVKIDRMFVRDITQSEEARKIVTAIIAMARALGMQVTAEGVEDAATLKILADLGCDLAQGYYLGRPFPAEAQPAR